MGLGTPPDPHGLIFHTTDDSTRTARVAFFSLACLIQVISDKSTMAPAVTIFAHQERKTRTHIAPTSTCSSWLPLPNTDRI